MPPWGEKVSEDGAKKKQVELRDKEYKTPDGSFELWIQLDKTERTLPFYWIERRQTTNQ